MTSGCAVCSSSQAASGSPAAITLMPCSVNVARITARLAASSVIARIVGMISTSAYRQMAHERLCAPVRVHPRSFAAVPQQRSPRMMQSHSPLFPAIYPPHRHAVDRTRLLRHASLILQVGNASHKMQTHHNPGARKIKNHAKLHNFAQFCPVQIVALALLRAASPLLATLCAPRGSPLARGSHRQHASGGATAIKHLTRSKIEEWTSSPSTSPRPPRVHGQRAERRHLRDPRRAVSRRVGVGRDIRREAGHQRPLLLHAQGARLAGALGGFPLGRRWKRQRSGSNMASGGKWRTF